MRRSKTYDIIIQFYHIVIFIGNAVLQMKLFSAAPPAAPGRERPVLNLLLSFLLPLAIILIALAGLKVTPFGDRTLLIVSKEHVQQLYIATGRSLMRLP